MWTIIITIVLTSAFDYGLGFLVSYNKKKQEERDNELFIFKLEQLLENNTIDLTDRISKAQELCRNTIGKLAAGSYMALDSIRKALSSEI